MQRDFLLAFGLFGQYDSSQPGWELLLMPHSHGMLQLVGTSGPTQTAPFIFQIGKEV